MPHKRLMSRSTALLLLLLCGVAVSAQATVPVVMLSDIHLDPFHNPRLLPKLRSTPIEQWPAILDAAPNLREDADRAALQLECHSISLDTAWPLLKSALVAAHDQQRHPVFVTLSGDLLAHQFPCRFHHLAPDASPEDLAAFSAKTVKFVEREVRLAFPHAPVYAALGNNDSGCGDYDETAGSPFMQSALDTMLGGAGQAGAHRHTKPEIETSPGGDYSVAFPRPLMRGRLIVLEDIYDAQNYRTCAAVREHAPEAAQIAWLRTQLQQARARKEQVWVMGHIPPGIDVYSSFYKYILRPGELCSAHPHEFLADAALPDTLLDFADVIRVAIFAHTHMDEIRVLHRPASEGRPEAIVPLKLVPSITPYFGNHPAFFVAAVDPRTLVLKDWESFVSPSPDGSAPPWPMAYRYTKVYGLPDFSAATAERLATQLAADRSGKDLRSHAYRDHFYAGDVGLYALGLEQIWPAYACAVREFEPGAFHGCLCPAEQPPAGKQP